jgi:hypothetical protein
VFQLMELRQGLHLLVHPVSSSDERFLSSLLILCRQTDQCRDYQCTRLDPVAPGGACSGNFDCTLGIACVNGFCTGGEDTCQATDGNTQAIGPSTDCTSGFCRGGSCSNVPAAYLGDICDEDRDCAGSDNNPSKDLLYCGQARANVRRCGSVGASCVATDGTGTGAAPDLCISCK